MAAAKGNELMKSEQWEHCIDLLQKFIHEDAPPLGLARQLEVKLDELLPESDEIQTLVLALAAYRPGGGPYLYNKSTILPSCNSVMRYLVEEGSRHETS